MGWSIGLAARTGREHQMRMTEEQYQAFLTRSVTWQGARQGSAPIASPATSPKPTTQKYRNRKVTDAEGRVHDSTKEYRRWQELQLLECAGAITELRRQVPFALVVEGMLICEYVSDFEYVDRATGVRVVEDVKPTFKDDAARKKYHATLAYRHFKLKAKLMAAIFKIQVREV